MPDAVLLDVGGVIVLPDFAPVEVVLSELGDPPGDSFLDRAHYVAVAALDHAYLTESPDLVAAYVAGFVRALGRSDSLALSGAIETAFTSGWSRTILESVAAIRQLHEWGHPVVLVSNSLGSVEEGLRGICQVGAGPGASVDGIIDSFRVGVEKPDPRIFELALATVAGTREAAVHVGDSIVYDVRGAQAAGIRAIHFDPSVSCKDRGHGHIISLAELRVT